jgi:Protein of unknown function (DUF2723)
VRSPILIVAACVATIAFVSYTRTLLPGVDLGDTGGFQAAVLWPEVSARQAYPLYYSLAAPFVGAVASTNPARGLNLFSALSASLAVGLLAAVTAQVSRSLVGGAVAGLLLAFSYTFWTQAVIAEVYSLHLALVGLCLVSLAAYAQRPTLARLLVFFAVYAVSFGNHLSMILLFVPFAVFLFMVVDKPRSLLQPAVIVWAVVIACAGALQYLPNLLAIWTAADAPARWTERLAAFWFDVTKADWRESMVLGISAADIPARLRMFAFDARQQFGIAGVLMAIGGAVALRRTSRAWGSLVVLAYLLNTAFAFSYNVGDPHVFFLPGHFFAALAAGCFVASAAQGSRLRQAVVIVLGLFLVAWRGYDTWPAADRHDDRRATQLVQRLTFGLDENRALLVTALNWQIENALLYESRYGNARRVAWTRLSDVFLHFPLLVADNHATSRDVVLTARAAADVTGAFGSLLPVVPDPIPPTPTLVSTVARVPRGAPYVLVVLPPPVDEVLDREILGDAIASLTGRGHVLRGDVPYEVIVGTAGDRPLYHRSATEPFRERVSLPEGALDIRMDSWVSLETFRRGGFGHVMLGRNHLMSIERGVSLVWLDRQSQAEPFYAAGLYAPRPRFRLPSAALPQHALLH